MFNGVEYVRELCKKKKIAISKLEKDCGFSNGYLNPKKVNKIPYERAVLISKYLNVDVNSILNGPDSFNSMPKSMLPDGAIPVDMLSFINIPIIGCVRCGEPIFVESNIEGYQPTSSDDLIDGYDYFYLRAKGDSMINAGINKGDLLLIRKQNDVDSGDIAIVNVNGDYETLKRVIKKNGAIILQPENPSYETKIFIGKELSDINIQGRLMQVIKKY